MRQHDIVLPLALLLTVVWCRCSRFVRVAVGMDVGDVIVSSHLLGAGGAAMAAFGGVDPSMDPELAAVSAPGMID